MHTVHEYVWPEILQRKLGTRWAEPNKRRTTLLKKKELNMQKKKINKLELTKANQKQLFFGGEKKRENLCCYT